MDNEVKTKENLRGKENSNRKRKRAKRLKFSAFYYFLAGTISFFWRIVFRIKIRKSAEFKNQKGAYLLVANHTSPFDMISAVGVVYPKRQNFVVAESMLYHSKFFARVLTKFGAILKKQYYSDFSCVRNIKKYMDAGIPVLICPEGKVSDDGLTQPIVQSTGKLIKWLGYPVVSCVSHGAALMRPKWARTLRRGRVVFDCNVALSAEDTKSLSVEQINDIIQKSLYNNDHIYQEENKIKFKGRRLAEGLESILYKCPKCNAEFEMKSRNRTLSCKNCGNGAIYGEDGVITKTDEQSVVFRRIDLWEDFIRQSIREELRDDSFKIEASVELHLDNPQNHKFYFASQGKLFLDKEKIVYVSENQENNVSFPLLNSPTLVTMPGKNVTLYQKDAINKFVFKEKLMSTKFSWTVEELAKLRNS